MTNSTPLFWDVLHEAREAGAEVVQHSSGNIIIDGHRWDRWHALRHAPEAKPIVITKPHGAGSAVYKD